MTAMTHTPHLGRVALALAAAGVLTLAGCANTPEPPDVVPDTTPPSKSAPATPSATPSPTPTVTPTKDLEAQLLAATNNFYATINHAYETLDAAPIAATVVPDSGAGKGYVDAINDARSKHHHYENIGKYSVSNFSLSSNDTGITDFQSASMTVSHTGMREVDEQGGLVQQIKAAKFSAHLVFNKNGDKWLIARQQVS
jgi:hypothetical protein